MASYCLLVLVLEERVYVPSATVQCATLRVVKRLWLCACVFMHNAEAARLCVRLCCAVCECHEVPCKEVCGVVALCVMPPQLQRVSCKSDRVQVACLFQI
eukprot:TRINITY_DN6984_c0_g1_i4.p2 TRINITY_DN6984_c0_g1~~TRINITY_DN6984_c0_g1_i4.p2  ORF type:complete len:100 (-),score=7.56 TRINITY_DN6984_c0_g1_i4:99-398(-)